MWFCHEFVGGDAHCVEAIVGPIALGNVSANVASVDSWISASRGERTCARNTRWRRPLERAKCPPNTIVESAKLCTDEANLAYQPLVVPREVPSDGAGKRGVSSCLFVEENLVNDTF